VQESRGKRRERDGEKLSEWSKRGTARHQLWSLQRSILRRAPPSEALSADVARISSLNGARVLAKHGRRRRRSRPELNNRCIRLLIEMLLRRCFGDNIHGLRAHATIWVRLDDGPRRIATYGNGMNESDTFGRRTKATTSWGLTRTCQRPCVFVSGACLVSDRLGSPRIAFNFRLNLIFRWSDQTTGVE